MDHEAYTITWPAAFSSAAVFSSPHSGRGYSEAFIRASRLDPLALRASEDAFVDQLFAFASEAGAPLIAARAPRAFVDLNRGADELDPAVVKGAATSGFNPRVAAGLGVIPRVVAEGRPIYDGKITLSEAEERLQRFYHPWHEALAGLMQEAERRHGAAVLFDCHSMPADALRASPLVRGARAEIVLSDRFGASCAPVWLDYAVSVFEQAGFRVLVNAPFAGGFITRRYGRPSKNWHAIQIEIDRGLYLDQSKITPSDGFSELQSRLKAVIRRLCEAGRARGQLAAE